MRQADVVEAKLSRPPLQFDYRSKCSDHVKTGLAPPGKGEGHASAQHEAGGLRRLDSKARLAREVLKQVTFQGSECFHFWWFEHQHLVGQI